MLDGCTFSCRYAELERGGLGKPTGYTGMVWSAFRPSDDPQVNTCSMVTAGRPQGPQHSSLLTVSTMHEQQAGNSGPAEPSTLMGQQQQADRVSACRPDWPAQSADTSMQGGRPLNQSTAVIGRWHSYVDYHCKHAVHVYIIQGTAAGLLSRPFSLLQLNNSSGLHKLGPTSHVHILAVCCSVAHHA